MLSARSEGDGRKKRGQFGGETSIQGRGKAKNRGIRDAQKKK